MSWPWIAVVLMLVVVVVAQGLLMIGLMTRIEPMLTHMQTLLDRRTTLRPAAGTRLPDAELRDGDGAPVYSSQWLGRPRLLLFATATCPPCTALLDDLRTPTVPEPAIPVMLVTDEESARVLRDGTLPDWLAILHEHEDELSEGLEVGRTPLAVLVDQHNRVRHTAVPNTVTDLVHPTGMSADHVLSGRW
ncbi:redoxin family protein [Nocardia sp. NBC_00565]|uniref:hypothetical protein n=1 Tax=Nocardia sp. NBC_00565 TaxID=2975993 RepID=UPI002E8062D9|nr:hypothetical protein [Nocardia sp. NBC_00565]WUC05252.1 redoxin family protein [Nocardia sp. NBC_00565]